MPASVKVLIGLVAVLLMGWLHQGPLGGGERLARQIEARARAAIVPAELPGVSVRLERDPLRRAAILSGKADQFQREGQGSLKGLNDLVGETEGVDSVTWVGEGEPAGLPLLVEALALLLLAYLAGLGLGAFLFGRRRRQSYLD